MLNVFRSLIGRKFTPLNLITISKQRLIENYNALSKINPEIKVAPVLKSNAYGHGLGIVGKILDETDAPFICVDSLYEAFQIYSKAKAKTPVLIMGYVHPKSLAVKKLPFSFALYDLEHAQVLNKYQKGARVHIFIDTGMHREGVTMSELPGYLEELKKLENIKIEGLMTHFAELGKPDSSLTKLQAENFKQAQKLVKEAGFKLRWVHIGGILGLVKKGLVDCNLVRVGKAFYGIDDADSAPYKLNIKPALEFKTKIVQIKKVKRGETVGYNGTYVASSDRTIAVLPLGYNDGVDRRLSNKGVFMVAGVECPIVGLVSMNITTIDITGVKGAFLDQEAVFISMDSKDKNSIIEQCDKGGVLPHEMLIHIAESTKRTVV